MRKIIETKLVSPPRFKIKCLDCANCHTRSVVRLPVKQTSGVIECDVCEAKTSWEEVDELTTLEKDAIRRKANAI